MFVFFFLLRFCMQCALIFDWFLETGRHSILVMLALWFFFALDAMCMVFDGIRRQASSSRYMCRPFCSFVFRCYVHVFLMVLTGRPPLVAICTGFFVLLCFLCYVRGSSDGFRRQLIQEDNLSN